MNSNDNIPPSYEASEPEGSDFIHEDGDFRTIMLNTLMRHIAEKESNINNDELDSNKLFDDLQIQVEDLINGYNEISIYKPISFWEYVETLGFDLSDYTAFTLDVAERIIYKFYEVKYRELMTATLSKFLTPEILINIDKNNPNNNYWQNLIIELLDLLQEFSDYKLSNDGDFKTFTMQKGYKEDDFETNFIVDAAYKYAILVGLIDREC